MARPATKFADVNSSRQRDELTTVWKSHHCHYTRVRAHAILLSGQGYEISRICDIFGVDRDSVSSWIDRFNQGGADALEDANHPGPPPMLDEQEQEVLKRLFKKHPNRSAKILEELERETGKKMSKWTLPKYAKKFALTWTRFRRSLKQKRNEMAFRRAQQELAELIAEPDLDVVFFDEAGFSLKGVVPYGWQPIGERYDVPVTGAHGSNVQVMGFQTQDGTTATYLHKGYVTSETVIQVFDEYCQMLTGTTVVVLDNASCHTSGAFQARLDHWAERGLLIYHLPPYSPELNTIERFWRKLKYQLLPANAWERFQELLTTLTSTLSGLGVVTYMPSLHNYAE